MERRSAALIREPYEDLNGVRPAPDGLPVRRRSSRVGWRTVSKGLPRTDSPPGNPVQGEEVGRRDSALQ
jgi:hypothetical protein